MKKLVDRLRVISQHDYLKSSRPHRAEFILVVLAGALLASLYLYTDMAEASACGVKFWTCIKERRFSMFYWEAYFGAAGSALEMQVGGSYDFALYLLFALYNLPLWIWEQITGFSFMQFIVTREYIKGIVWIFVGVSAYLSYRIARVCDVEEDEARWIPLLFFTSALFFHAQVVIGGYDIISVAFTLLGIYAYLTGNQKGFIVSFAFAIAMKMFAVWIFIPLVLLKEKRIWRIFLYGIEGISVIAIPKIFFHFASHSYMINQAVEQAAEKGEIIDSSEVTAGYATNEILSQAEGIINDALFPRDRIVQFTLISMDALPLVFVGMFAIWIFCYLCRKKLENRQIIYLCALIMGVFILTVKLHPQWAIILLPYLILLISFHPERMRENLLLEGVFSVGYVLNKAVTYPWTCNLNLVDNMFMPQHRFSYGNPDVDGSSYGFSSVITRVSEVIGISDTHIGYIFKAAAVTGLIMFLVYNYPGRRVLEQENTQENVDYRKRRQWLFYRFVVSCLVGMLPLVGLVVYLL